MKCPHCNIEVNENFSNNFIGNDKDGRYNLLWMNCPNVKCEKFIIKLQKRDNLNKVIEEYLVRPITASRPPVPVEVDKNFSDDYNEACLVVNFSPKASAALSRRCLQNILREKAGVKKGDLANEIQEVIDDGKLPTYLIESIDAIRNIGNFAAHPNKSKITGEIVPVEIGEAEWLLDVIESLFDFYFVQPKILQEKRNELNKKLADLGKPKMK
ncbi:DUF4145 domain-containing protein [Candidatus Kaistella beijingensis]|uniref:DUF4145 domain-containing protein n=1 Tax=Candidatus Kaistella beijingensis TaxID=2820270 RepID=UPI001CC3A3B9|nr:DUF4145 domain-containing protein [Candidatus Kaistella beijingensis]UBB89990.1 DUF4145 domain-containing protein [Candidatus Kaistella beijingensis]